MTSLLDVNVLVALAWPNHVHHRTARAWFRRNAKPGWSTCPLTESGFVRVSCNPATPHAVTLAEAFALLERIRRIEGHQFWEDDISLVASPHVDRTRIASHRQVTDAHLLALARRHGGRLVTFDQGAQRVLSRGDDPTLAVIRPSR